MNFLNVFSSIEKTGGASYNINTGELNPESGYIISLPEFEKVVPMPKTFSEFQDALLGWLNARIWNVIGTNEDVYLGFWKHGDFLILDLSDRWKNRYQAITVGNMRKQKAIFNANSKEVIYL